MTPEICLWRSVVLQAFHDACGVEAIKPSSGGGKPRGEDSPQREKWRNQRIKYDLYNAEQEKKSARSWLLFDTENFPKICYFAGWDPVPIREGARGLADAGWPVRVVEWPDYSVGEMDEMTA